MTNGFGIDALLLGAILTGIPYGAQAQMMGGASMGAMMWLMAVFWLLIVVGLVLAIAALIKYLFKK